MENLEDSHKKTRVQFIVKETYTDEFSAMTNKCIRSILWTAELVLGKDSEEYANIRKAVLDNVNTLNRDITLILERDVFPKIGN